MNELVVLLDGEEVGIVRQRAGRLSFTYHEAWQSSPGGYPLSLSLPLAAAEHPHAAVNTYLWGLLPDNERVLERWARQFQVSARSAFGLLAAVGEDCAGAVQLVPRARAARITRGRAREVDWLSTRDVARRLRALVEDAAAWRASADEGQFSLAGAQPKTALYFERGRWGVPRGRTPTTHILKPTLPTLDGHAENEHLCLELARELGLPTATSKVQRFEDLTAVVVERYDRVPLDGVVRRVHQEDLCQALGRLPNKKYENEGGPSAADVVGLLRAAVVGDAEPSEASPVAETDVRTFIDALVFNWLIGGTDGHAKNYSLLLGPGRVRLAPLYDLGSIYAYPDIQPKKAKLAMKIAGKYRIEEIHPPQWKAFARTLRVSSDELVERLWTLAATLKEALPAQVSRLREAGLTHPILPRIEAAVTERAKRLVRQA